jgi:hypothetical protein
VSDFNEKKLNFVFICFQMVMPVLVVAGEYGVSSENEFSVWRNLHG